MEKISSGVVEKYEYNSPLEQSEHIKEMEDNGWRCESDGLMLNIEKGYSRHFALFIKYN